MNKILWKIIISAFIFSADVPDGLSDDKRCKQSSEKGVIYSILFVFWAVTICILVLSYFYFFSRSTVFTVSASVEKVSIAPYVNQKYPAWKFDKAKLHPDCGEKSSEVSGLLYPDSNAYIEFLRVQNGELVINLDSDETDSVGTFITTSNTSIKLDDCASVRLSLKNVSSHIFPIEGEVILGGDIKEGSDRIPILYNGKVTIVDKALFTRDYYSVGPFELEMGDIFIVKDLVVKSSGFIQLDDEKGIKVTYSSKGSKGFIKKYKTESIEIRNGIWTKIYNDPSLILLWFIGLAFYSVSKKIIRIKVNKIFD